MGIRIESIGLFENNNGAVKTSLELVRRAAEPCIAGSRYNKEDIGVLINTSVYRDDYFCEPAFASYVQNDLEINHDKEDSLGSKTLSFDVSNGAMGFLNACQLAGAMIASGKAKTGLVVSGDLVDYDIIKKGDSPGFYVSGAAMLLDEVPGAGSGFSSFYFRTFADMQKAYESYLILDNKRMAMMFKKNPALEKIYLDVISRGVSEFLTKEGVVLDGFDLIIPPQISPGFVTVMADHLGVEKEKMIDVTREDGDLFNASLPVAIDHIYKNDLASPGQKALIINVASGIQVGCAIYDF
ncbi:MAG: hypothetical protein JRC60_02100 [Deltaproteobacteria bacterium]|nr:hypothetical protein [Deltaproteobacteria bacterium]